MGFYGDTDIQPMLKDVGGASVVTAHTSSTWGALNLNDQLAVYDAERGQVAATVPSVEIQVTAYPAADIAIDAPITVAGVNYIVREHDAPGDGAIKKLYLRKA